MRMSDEKQYLTMSTEKLKDILAQDINESSDVNLSVEDVLDIMDTIRSREDIDEEEERKYIESQFEIFNSAYRPTD